MIDIHSHILYGVDDGAKTKEESIKIIKEAQNAGFTDVCLTPHYIPYSYEIEKKEITKRIKELKECVKENNIDIKIYQGTENYVCQDLDKLIKNNVTSTINSSRYILFELPMNSKVIYLSDILYKLFSMNLVPIIAHPERYLYVQEDPNMLIDLIEKGVLFQSNYGSIIGEYGKTAKKTVEKLLKHDMIHFLATDVHRSGRVYPKMKEILKSLGKLVDEDKVHYLTNENPRLVIENKEIEIYMPRKIKRFFG